MILKHNYVFFGMFFLTLIFNNIIFVQQIVQSGLINENLQINCSTKSIDLKSRSNLVNHAFITTINKLTYLQQQKIIL